MFIILDADALVLVGEDPEIIKGYRRAVITPNINEFNRLLSALGIDRNAKEDQKAALVSKALGGVTVLQKGASDLIAVDTTAGDLEKSQIRTEDPLSESLVEIVKVDVAGGLKRCGGQGDILSGLVGTVLAWGKNYEDGVFK
jgi:ATP-dependent NAD(P)H-hydrate dehydratase